MPDDHSLVERCQRGDNTAFSLLFRRHRQRLYDLACVILRDEEGAADVVQDTFVIVYNKIGSFRGASSFETWLIAIAVNECRARLRRRKVRRFLSLEGMRQRVADRLADRQPAPERAVELRQQQAQLWAHVDRLDERLRIPILLRYGHGMPAAEIAEILGIPRNRLYQQLYEGRQQLRRQLMAGDWPLADAGSEPGVESC